MYVKKYSPHHMQRVLYYVKYTTLKLKTINKMVEWWLKKRESSGSVGARVRNPTETHFLRIKVGSSPYSTS